MNINEFVPRVPPRLGNTRPISPAKHWVFTYNTLMSELQLSQFETLCSSCSNKWVFQEEIGESGNNHLQGYICFTTKKRPKSVFQEHPTIHWEKCKRPKEAITYCQKQDTRVPNKKLHYRGIIPEVTLRVLKLEQLFKWQSQVCDLIDTSDGRTIYWMYEPEGNVGKSALVKYLCVNFNAILLSGKGADMKYGIMSYRESKGGWPTLILIDVPRTVLDYVSYSAIEEIKNGCFFSGKYESGMAIFNSPTILCFANEKPKCDKMSLDRWCVYEIINKELYKKCVS